MAAGLRKQQKVFKEEKGKIKRKKYMLIRIFCMLIFFLGFWGAYQVFENRYFETTYYKLESDKVKTSIKFVVLSDLHSMEYGLKNCDLIQSVKNEEPDFIAMIGDMVNKDDTDFTVIRHLCRELKKIAPIYYTLGNHEGNLMYGRSEPVKLDEMLNEDGVNVLINQTVSFQKEDTTICIAGIAIEAAGYDQWAKEKMEKFWLKEDYKIVLSHFPDLYYSKLKDAKMDLAFAGHYHGGIIRIPGIGGLYHPQEGLFPKYSGGQYNLTNGKLIVSRGMDGHKVMLRINNRPELVVVEIE